MTTFTPPELFEANAIANDLVVDQGAFGDPVAIEAIARRLSRAAYDPLCRMVMIELELRAEYLRMLLGATP